MPNFSSIGTLEVLEIRNHRSTSNLGRAVLLKFTEIYRVSKWRALSYTRQDLTRETKVAQNRFVNNITKFRIYPTPPKRDTTLNFFHCWRRGVSPPAEGVLIFSNSCQITQFEKFDHEVPRNPEIFSTMDFEITLNKLRTWPRVHTNIFIRIGPIGKESSSISR